MIKKYDMMLDMTLKIESRTELNSKIKLIGLLMQMESTESSNG
jgi:hypothetical protein